MCVNTHTHTHTQTCVCMPHRHTPPPIKKKPHNTCICHTARVSGVRLSLLRNESDASAPLSSSQSMVDLRRCSTATCKAVLPAELRIISFKRDLLLVLKETY